MSLYTKVLKLVFFKMDPEDVHNRVTRLGKVMGSNFILRSFVKRMFYFQHNSLHTTVAGIKFSNPVGLAAGFDKNANLYNILPDVGFGFAELGSVTGEKCSGNPRPRLFRLPDDKSIIVNYGLYNKGCEVIYNKLKDVSFRIPIGISVAKTNTPDIKTTEEGIKDYRKAFVTMHPIGSYTTINFSCPNTSDGQTFGYAENLDPLLKTLSEEKHLKPVFLKVKPDMTNSQFSEIIDIVEKHDWVNGFIIGNLTMDRNGLKTPKEVIDKMSPKGGLSGLPTQQKSNNLIKFVHKNSDKLIIGCGGIFSGVDAYEKLKNGAVLVQLVSALIFEGPGIVSKINRELVDIIQKEGYNNISEIGKD